MENTYFQQLLKVFENGYMQNSSLQLFVPELIFADEFRDYRKL